MSEHVIYAQRLWRGQPTDTSNRSKIWFHPDLFAEKSCQTNFLRSNSLLMYLFFYFKSEKQIVSDFYRFASIILGKQIGSNQCKREKEVKQTLCWYLDTKGLKFSTWNALKLNHKANVHEFCTFLNAPGTKFHLIQFNS